PPPAGPRGRTARPIPPRARRTGAARRPWWPRRRRRRTGRMSGRRTGSAPRRAGSYRREPAEQVVAEPGGALVCDVAGAHERPELQRLLEARPTEQRRHDARAEHVATPGRIAATPRDRGTGGGDPGSADRPSGETGRTLAAERHHERPAPLGQGARRDNERVVPELAHLVLVQLHGVEAAKPRGCIRQSLRHARPIGLLAEEQVVEVRIQEAGEPAAQELRGAEVHLVAGNEIEVEGVEVRDHRAQLGPGPGGHAARELFAAALRF